MFRLLVLPCFDLGLTVHMYIRTYTYLSVRQSGLGATCATHKHNQLIEAQYSDVNTQRANVTSSMNLLNTKLPV